ncbi:Ig-like domain-containing protein [Brevibacillus ginsengisoli]|uniref:Ig-like domain-containing protein n=1 Tax=Brevibacillus ginsengisoli TaxID=363854 RepID=UPI003CF2D312
MKIWLSRMTKVMLLVTLLVFSIGDGLASAASISRLILSKNTVSLEVGDSLALTATALFDSGTTENATVKTDWKSGSDPVASVYAGTITAKTEGTAVITATYMGLTEVVNVSVHKKVKALYKDKQTIDIRSGGQDHIQLTALYSDGSSENVTNKADWTIDNYAIATVMNGLVVGQSSGTATITAKYGSQTVTVPVNVEIIRRLDPSKTQVSIFIKGTETIQLMATLANGNVEDVAAKAEWSSDKPGVADAIKGVITGYGTGQAVITAKYGGKTATIRVDVAVARKLAVDKPNLYLPNNTSEQVKLMVTYEDGTSEDITDKAQWTSNKESIAFVSKGKISAYAPGEAVITATYGDKSATVQVDVDVPRKLALNKTSLSLRSGESQELKLTATYANGTTEDVSDKAEWSSSNQAVAYVVKGKVAAYTSGETTLTAKYGEKTVSCILAVDIPSKIQLSKETVSLQVGKTETLSAHALYADGRDVDVTSQAEWISSAPTVAEIRGGTITALTNGTASITVRYGNRLATVQVNVGVIQTLTVDPTNLVMGQGETKNLSLTATYMDGTKKDVTSLATWTSAQPTVASVTQGTVTANTNGHAVITAAFESKTVTIPVDIGMAQSLEANVKLVVLAINESKKIVLEAKDANNKIINVTETAEWISSNGNVATVDKGYVLGRANGRANITAKYGGKTIVIPVEVGILQKLEASVRYLSLKSGQKVQITLKATLSDGTTKDVTNDAEWKSGQYKVADVADGLVTGTSYGKTTILIRYATKVINIPIEVDNLKYLKTSDVKITLKKGTSTKVSATATYMDGSELNVTKPAYWSSSHIQIADAKDGIIKANEVGVTNITVSYAGKRASIIVIVQE